MKLIKKLVILLSLLALLSFQQTDRFVGKVVVEWLDDGRKMKLLEDFAYIDPNGKTWKAPKGSKIDGASIPRLLWSVIGGPYEEKYRKASVVHDYYCVKPQNESWENVHLMFYNACVTEGTSQIKAKVMYAAVYAGGPRWEISYTKSGNTSISKIEHFKTFTQNEKFENIKRWIEQNNPDLSKINDTLNTVVIAAKF